MWEVFGTNESLLPVKSCRVLPNILTKQTDKSWRFGKKHAVAIASTNKKLVGENKKIFRTTTQESMLG